MIQDGSIDIGQKLGSETRSHATFARLWGTKRLKEHLASGYADTVMCSKTTTEIRKEMRAYLKKIKW
jgi:hypothetical protein